MAHSWFTEHARARMQQRGISPAAIEILLSYGRSSHDHRGCEVVYFDKPARQRLAKYNPVAAREAERFTRAYAVLGSNGVVVTVGHRYRRFKRR
jgi:hypothetical protein